MLPESRISTPEQYRLDLKERGCPGISVEFFGIPWWDGIWGEQPQGEPLQFKKTPRGTEVQVPMSYVSVRVQVANESPGPIVAALFHREGPNGGEWFTASTSEISPRRSQSFTSITVWEWEDPRLPDSPRISTLPKPLRMKVRDSSSPNPHVVDFDLAVEQPVAATQGGRPLEPEEAILVGDE